MSEAVDQAFEHLFPGEIAAFKTALTERDRLAAENERLREACKLAVAYDDLLLKFKGPSVIFAGDALKIDNAYDAWVSATRAALSEAKQ